MLKYWNKNKNEISILILETIEIKNNYDIYLNIDKHLLKQIVKYKAAKQYKIFQNHIDNSYLNTKNNSSMILRITYLIYYIM